MISGRALTAAGLGGGAHLLSSWAPAAVVLAGYGLRLFRLGAPSLGYDEAFDLFVAGRGLDYLFSLLATQEPYPPLHFVSLHYWMRLVGDSEFAARYLSVGFGLLTVALVQRLGSAIGGGRVGLAAALVVACSSPCIWYSQESKMYPMVTFFSLLSTWFSLQLLDILPAGRWSRPAYVLATVTALGSHYPAGFVLLAQNLLAAVRIGRGQPCLRLLRLWALAQAAVLVMLLPWGLYVGRFMTGYSSTAPGSASPLSILRLFWQVFGVGYSDELYHPLGSSLWVAASFAILGVLGTAYLAHRRPWGALAMVCGLAVPLAVVMLVSQWRAVFAARHLAVASPFYYLLVGAGLVAIGSLPVRRVWRWPAMAAGATLTGLLLGITLGGYYFDPVFTRTDNRSVGLYLAEHGQPGDAVVFSAPYTRIAVHYYYRGGLPWVGLPEEGNRLDEDRAAARLAQLAGRHSHLWLVLWQDYATDPGGFVERWMARNLERSDEGRFASIAVRGYSAESSTWRPGFVTGNTLSADFGRQVSLLGYDLPRKEWRSGETLRLTLYWKAQGRLERPYTGFAHLVDDGWRMWAQDDGVPHRGKAPTVDWRPDEVISDLRELRLAPELSPGEYKIQVGMYDSATVQRLEVLDGAGRRLDDKVLIGPVIVR